MALKDKNPNKMCRVCREFKPRIEFSATAAGRESTTCNECKRRIKQAQQYRHREMNSYPKESGVVTRVCKKCGQSKPERAFLPGFSHCRECQRKRRESIDEAS